MARPWVTGAAGFYLCFNAVVTGCAERPDTVFRQLYIHTGLPILGKARTSPPVRRYPLVFDGVGWTCFDPGAGEFPAGADTPPFWQVVHDESSADWGVWSPITQTRRDLVFYMDTDKLTPAPAAAHAPMLAAVQARHGWPPPERFEYYVAGGGARTRPLFLGILNDLSVLAALGCFALSLAWVPRALRRRARPGQCPACRYERAGLAPDAPCPECGACADASNLRAMGESPPSDRAG